MVRIGIMTFLHNENCGSSLQAYALQQTLREMGHEPFGLDYRPDSGEKLRNLLQSGNRPGVVLDSLRRKQGRGDRNTMGFNVFNNMMLSLSAPARNRKELAAAASDCDLLLSGSDQVWSPEWLNPAYFYDFIQDKPKIAYACSLGISVSPGPRKEARLKQLAGDFRHISVREEEGRRLLRSLLPDREIAVMPDPVFLRTREQWLELSGRPKQAPVLAAYFIKDDPSYAERARAQARDAGLSLQPLAVTPGMLALPDAVPNPAPLDWLSAMVAATRVITDSFHGAAMAAILGKPLTILRRWSDEDPQSKNSRIDQLMRQLGWTQEVSCLPGEAVNARLEELREDGLSWLRDAIQESLEFTGKR